MKLTDLSRYNQWWKLGEDFAGYDNDLRNIKFLINRIEYGFNVGNVYVIRGPRRAGKSVYIKLRISELIKVGVEPRNILYLPCDRLSGRKELHRLIREFIRFNMGSKRMFIFLDEATYLPEWFLVIKDLAEDPIMDSICIVATGSSPVSLKEASERLPGRRVEGNEFWFMPLSFREFIMNVPKEKLPVPEDKIVELRRLLRGIRFDFEKPDLSSLARLLTWHDELESLLEIYLRTGGIPEFIVEYLTDNRISARSMEMLVRFVLSEISKAKKSENITVGILRYLTDNLMQRVDYRKIATSIDVHHTTVRDIIETLQKALIIFQINYLDINTRRLLPRKQKKFAFTDISLVSALRSYIYGLAWEDLIWEIEKIKPHLIENLITSTAINSIHEPYRKEWWTRIAYYYTEKYEIDLVLLTKTETLSYEVKYAEKMGATRAKITITKDDIDIEKMKIPATYILATTQKSQRVL